MALITPEQLAALPPEIRTLFQAVIDHYEARIAKLEAEIARLKKNSRNSSKPPSSEHPHAKPLPQKTKSARKQGGQPGHQKFERLLKPTDQCDRVFIHKPAACRGCGAQLTGDDRQPLRHQVWELPEIKPTVTEHQRHRLGCRYCGASTCAPLPAGVPNSQAGPNLTALVALLMGGYRQSKRRTAKFLEEVLGQPCSTGWVVKLQNQASAALETPYAELVAALADEPVVNMDETPAKEANQKGWLWTCVAKRFTCFTVRPNRKAEAIAGLLGENYAGIVGCDRAKMYYSLDRVQWCWAHLKRDFQALIDSPDRQAQRLGRDLMRPTAALFAFWGRIRDGTLTRVGFQRKMQPIRQQIENLLLRGKCSGNRQLRGMCRPLYQRRAWLWTFLEAEGVEPTNNAAERALRHAVIWRKLSFGTQSAAGSRFVERMLTLTETCRQQGRNALAYLQQALQAQLEGKPAPSLLHGA